jgi:hypothetical protein
MGPRVGGDRGNRRTAAGLAGAGADSVAVDSVAVVVRPVARSAEGRQARARVAGAEVLADTAAGVECRGLLREWADRPAAWAVLAECQAPPREWAVVPLWAVRHPAWVAEYWANRIAGAASESFRRGQT